MLVTFVDREAELAQIEALIGEWGSRRVLCIHGQGGVGKTRLLQEVYQRYLTKSTSRLLIAGILDFDDLRLHVPENVGQQIAGWLDPQVFEPYLRALMDWRKMEMAGVSRQRLNRERLIADQTFVRCFNEVSAQRRVALLMDTTDALRETEDVWEYVQRLALQLQNCLLLIAGRNANDLYQVLHPKLDDVVQDLELEPLGADASAAYLEHKQEQLHLALDPAIVKKLLLLARGLPILLDLAMEWLARDVPLPWLIERDLEELERLPPDELEVLHQEFVRQLVKHIRDLRTPMDKLILTLAQAYPLDQDGIAALLNMSQTDAAALLQEARSLVFIKPLPDGQITLHDEMRRLVQNHVWTEEEAIGVRRQHVSRRMADFLAHKVKAMRAEMGRLAAQEQRARVAQDAARELAAFLKRAELDRMMLQILPLQQIRQLMPMGSSEGCQVFVEAFDEATQAYRFLLRGPLVHEVMPYYDQLPQDQRYEVGIRIAKYLLDETQYQQAYDRAKDLLAFPYRDHRRVDTLIQLANNAIRLGLLEEGSQHFEKALALCEEYQLTDRKWWVMTENGLGWAYRVLGRWDEAIQHWLKAFDYSAEIGDLYRMAMILNNLGYVYYLTGDSRTGLTLSQQALEIAESVGRERQIAANHSTLGEIYVAFDQYQEALAHCAEALAFFEREADEEWMAVVYHELARAKYHQAFDTSETPIEQRKERLEEALRYAERGLQLCEEHNLMKEAPVIQYRIGSIKLDLGKVKESEKHLRKSLELSKAQEERFHSMVALAALAELAYLKREKTTVKDIAGEARKLMRKPARGEYPLFFGKILRTLAEVYLDEEEYDHALETYVQALTQIGRHGGYGKHRFDQEVKRLRGKIARLPEAVKADWSDRFIERWRDDKKRAAEHPEVITACLLAKLDLTRASVEERGDPYASK